jgi:hypothetical protein
MRAFPFLSEQVTPQAAKGTALVTVNQATDGLIECDLADLDERVTRTSARQKHEAGVEASHDVNPPTSLEMISRSDSSAALRTLN